MFRDVPGCSGMFRVPGFIDGLNLHYGRALKYASLYHVCFEFLPCDHVFAFECGCLLFIITSRKSVDSRNFYP